MTEELDPTENLPFAGISFYGREADFVNDNTTALKRLIAKMAELQSAVITIDLQRGIIAANITYREHFAG